MSTWSTGLCSCCAKPGGFCLCCRSHLCPCTVVGDINEHVNGFGGFWAACLCCPFSPCFLCADAPQVAEWDGKSESGLKAFCCTAFPLTSCCYIMQVYRQCQIQQEQGTQRPVQEVMR
ncbi:unnamed protein product [Polarella glacialis]|uniref:Uncharacterized protein n=1 Tax=Polarella glacialis TaxID=89957 RepID=A0A813LYX7_POLGL|nr:unnamed protein product [Polarella glacialis]|mmetsp:Transcript_71403/g.115210  ORF Transcript_71403/g.115210 Transcript_71403/m.115210 type:complete len:118 (-) Transcript_71403:115-468(-)